MNFCATFWRVLKRDRLARRRWRRPPPAGKAWIIAEARQEGKLVAYSVSEGEVIEAKSLGAWLLGSLRRYEADARRVGAYEGEEALLHLRELDGALELMKVRKGQLLRSFRREQAPGETLLRLARLLCSEATVQAVFVPTVSDLRMEHEAVEREHPWRARTVLVNGWLALIRAAAGLVVARAVRALGRAIRLG